MKTNHLRTYLLVVAVFLCSNIRAQRFTALLKTLAIDYPQEKLYLQFDRTLYNPGETIWFKAYLFEGQFPSQISKTLYAELTDAKGKVLQCITLPVVMSSAAGSMNIPADVSGPVFVRSYTKWMLNFDSSFLYIKAISIIAPQKTTGKLPVTSLSKTNPVTTSSSFSVQFFPEGGDLVQGVESRVAFKATNNGIPVKIAGDILDSKGGKITSFASIHDGMGTFILQPQGGEQYKAVWNQQGQNLEKLLPTAKENGIVLEADYYGNQIEFKIKRSSNTPAYPFVYVVVQMHQQQVYKAKAYMGKTLTATGIIPTENLPAGIVQVTIFTPDEQPLAERIIFVNLSGYSFITNLNAVVSDTAKRGKNVIQIEVPDTLSCNISVAITDADLSPGQSDGNIYSQLLLTGDIKGYIFNPSYYFSNDADSVANHLDLVMMTNGWRRFKWEEVMTGHFPKLNYIPENYISIEGQVQGLNKTLLSGKEINGILELKSKKKEFLNTPVQPEGKFTFSGMIFYDTAKFFYQFNKDKKKTLTSRAGFDIKSSLLKEPLHLQPGNSLLWGLRESDTATLTKNKDVLYKQQLNGFVSQKIKTLKMVVVTTKIKTKQDLLDEEYTSGAFRNDPGEHSRTILPEDDPAFLSSQNLISYLQNRIAGLQIDLSRTENAVTWRGLATSLFVNEISQEALGFTPPYEGKIIQDDSYILTIPMSDVVMVKIFDPPFFGDWGGGPGGAIAVYLKKARTGNQMMKGLDYTLLPGYSPVREFYSPDYSSPAQSDIADYRPTLYWNPFVITDKNHQRIELTFYNNDITKKMKVIIEGCNENGKLTRVERILE